jgi:type IV secretion system protein VirB6
VHESYRNLVGPDTTFAAALTGLLTIYVALLGYQILIGRGGLRVTELPLIAVKIGLILAFVTSWAAYQTVFFNLFFDGPRETMRVLLSSLPGHGPGFNGDVYAGLEHAYGELAAAAAIYGEQASPDANILQGGPMLGSGILWLSGLVMLLCTVGLIVAAKIMLALLLAVGPIFVACCLFEPSRGLFDSWLRTTIAFAFAPLSVSVLGAGMLLMLNPFLIQLAGNVWSRRFDMSTIITIALIVSVFAIVMMLAIRMGLGLVAGLRSERPAVILNPSPSETQSAPAPATFQTRIDHSSPANQQGMSMNLASRRIQEIGQPLGPTPI